MSYERENSDNNFLFGIFCDNNFKRSYFKMTQKPSADHILRVLLIGNSSVGKTCILKRFSDEEFDPNFITTIGVDFKIKTLDYHGKSVQLQVWDTAGQERFQSITKTYYRLVVGILILGGVTKMHT